MPTADDFRSAARTLRSDADAAQAAEDRVRLLVLDHGIISGPYVEAAVRGAAASAINAHATGTACHGVADEFDRRALVCDQYTADMRSYRNRLEAWESEGDRGYTSPTSGSADSWRGPKPSRPAKPATCVVEG